MVKEILALFLSCDSITIFPIAFSSNLPSLKHYDTLHSSQLGHRIVKRGVKESNHPFNSIKELAFTALGKDFRLILHPSKEVLHHNFQSYAVDADGVEKPVVGGMPILR